MKAFIAILAVALVIVACQPSKKPPPFPDQDAPGYHVLFAYCVQCHGAPQPSSRRAEQWPLIVNRMRQHRTKRNFTQWTDHEYDMLLAYLRSHAAP